MTVIVSPARKESHALQRSELWDAAARLETALAGEKDLPQKDLLQEALMLVHNTLRLIATEPNPSKYSVAARTFISQEIEHLVRDKRYALDRAIAAAITQARKRGMKVPPPPNPPLLALVNPAGAVGVGPVEAEDRGRLMGTGVHAIAYRHRDDGHDYEHVFKHWQAVKLRLLDERHVLIFSDSVPIVEMFEMED